MSRVYPWHSGLVGITLMITPSQPSPSKSTTSTPLKIHSALTAYNSFTSKDHTRCLDRRISRSGSSYHASLQIITLTNTYSGGLFTSFPYLTFCGGSGTSFGIDGGSFGIDGGSFGGGVGVGVGCSFNGGRGGVGGTCLAREGEPAFDGWGVFGSPSNFLKRDGVVTEDRSFPAGVAGEVVVTEGVGNGYCED